MVRIERATASVALVRQVRRATKCWYCVLRYVCRGPARCLGSLGQRRAARGRLLDEC